MKFNFSILIGAFLVVILPQAFASAPYYEELNHCLVIVDSKF